MKKEDDLEIGEMEIYNSIDSLVGKRVKIEKVEFIDEVTDYYNGKINDEVKTIKRVLITLEKVKYFSFKENKEVEENLKIKYYLKEKIINNISQWIMSKSKSAKLYKLCRVCGVEHPLDLKDKYVELEIAYTKNNNKFITIKLI